MYYLVTYPDIQSVLHPGDFLNLLSPSGTTKIRFSKSGTFPAPESSN